MLQNRNIHRHRDQLPIHSNHFPHKIQNLGPTFIVPKEELVLSLIFRNFGIRFDPINKHRVELTQQYPVLLQ